MTYLLTIGLTPRALVDLVIQQPTIFVTHCGSLFFFSLCSWVVWSLYYLPDVIIWVDARQARRCENLTSHMFSFSGLWYP